jgi:hypothetical protein
MAYDFLTQWRTNTRNFYIVCNTSTPVDVGWSIKGSLYTALGGVTAVTNWILSGAFLWGPGCTIR